jgi:hypothetical protein
MELKLLSNGFFKKNYFSLDYHEDIEFTEFNNTDEINAMVDDYSFNINDLKDLEAVNGDNILKEHFITDDEYEGFAVNYYVLYSRQKDKFTFVISIYDFDSADKELVNFIEKFGRQISIEINTDEEIKEFRRKFDCICKHFGYEDLADFYIEEFDTYKEEN